VSRVNFLSKHHPLILLKFFKKREKEASDWRENIRKLAKERKIFNASISTEDRRCGTCQEPLGKGIFNGVIIRDDNNEVYELYYHDLEGCWNYENIQQQILAKGHQIIANTKKSNLQSDDENLKSFLRDSLDLDKS